MSVLNENQTIRNNVYQVSVLFCSIKKTSAVTPHNSVLSSAI